MRVPEIPTRPLCLVALLAACEGRARAAPVEIEARPVSREVVRSESLASVESGSDGIRVRQTIRVPDRCRSLAGRVVQDGGELTLHVHVAPDGRSCEPDEAYLAYTAQVRGLEAGRYELRVVHVHMEQKFASPGAVEHPVVVLERAVEVP